MHTNAAEARPACLQLVPNPAKLSSTVSFRSREFCPNCFLWCKLLTLPYLKCSWAVHTPKLPGCVQTHIHTVSLAYRLTSRFVVQQPTFLIVLCCLFIILSFIQFPSPLFSHTYSPFSYHPPAVYLERCRMSSRYLSYVLLGVSPAKTLQREKWVAAENKLPLQFTFSSRIEGVLPTFMCIVTVRLDVPCDHHFAVIHHRCILETQLHCMQQHSPKESRRKTLWEREALQKLLTPCAQP